MGTSGSSSSAAGCSAAASTAGAAGSSAFASGCAAAAADSSATGPVPGTVQEDGTINHAANSNGSGAIIFTKAADQEGAWDFIKWFTSTDAQVKYGNNIESILGTMGRYATANEEALQQLSWTTSEVNLLLDQLNSQVEIPIIPASYGVTRNVMNAFRAVVNDYDNARDTLFWYNKDINDEITRKLEDLGLYDN